MKRDQSSLYNFTTTNLIESPNNYFYSNFLGIKFVDSWFQNRDPFINKYQVHGHTSQPQSYSELNSYSAEDILEFLYSSIVYGKSTKGLFELFIKRFEVTKRIYHNYTRELKASKGSQYENLNHYIRFGEILIYSYDFSKSLSELNALLKVLDILVSVSDNMTKDQLARFYRLIDFERKYIQSLMSNLGLDTNV
jgi:hypothetical protein